MRRQMGFCAKNEKLYRRLFLVASSMSMPNLSNSHKPDPFAELKGDYGSSSDPAPIL